MSWAFSGISTAASGTNPSITPPSNAAGDLLVIFAASETQYSALAGWTEVIRGTTSPQPAIGLWWKISSGSEGSASLTNADTTSMARMLCYTGVAASPYDSVSSVGAATNTSIATGTLTTANDNELVLSLYAARSIAGTWGSAPTDTTERGTTSPTSGLCGLYFCDENKAAAGTTTARTATIGGTIAMKSVAIAFIESAAVVGGLFFGSNF